MLRKVALLKKPYSECSRMIDEWIFNDKHRAMLKDYLLDGHTYERIAEDYEMSTRQVARIIPKLEAQLFERM